MPTYTITSDKKFHVLDDDEYQAIQERLEQLDILTSTSLKKDIAAARKALKEGKTIPLDKVMAELLEN